MVDWHLMVLRAFSSFFTRWIADGYIYYIVAVLLDGDKELYCEFSSEQLCQI